MATSSGVGAISTACMRGALGGLGLVAGEERGGAAREGLDAVGHVDAGVAEERVGGLDDPPGLLRLLAEDGHAEPRVAHERRVAR